MIHYLLALFFVLLEVFHVPHNDAFKAIRGLSRQLEGENTKINTSLESVAKWFATTIKMDEYKKAVMEADLRAARMEHLTPEMYIANCAVKAFVVGIMAIPVFPIMPLFSALILLMAVVYYYKEYNSLSKTVAARRDAIEFELSLLVFNIEKNLRHSRDIIQMLDSYAPSAGPELRNEIQITTADMRSGNYESAITRMENRIGSPMVSDVCRGLIGIIRGDDTVSYWQSLELRFEDYRREMLKAKADKMMPKVDALSMTMLVCFLGIWIVVIVVQVIESLAVLFM